MSSVMKTLYWSFNTITGYKHENPSPQSIEWRLIILESFAGVPGFLVCSERRDWCSDVQVGPYKLVLTGGRPQAAGFRHFYSLRSLKRDHGAIYTFLEEAENERMHLLVCMKMFEAGWITRALVIAAQVSMTPFLMLTYAVSPGAMHRFVGYLEETAVHTYSNIIKHVETPGTQLNEAWADLQAPDIAKKCESLPPGHLKLGGSSCGCSCGCSEGKG
eukprot:scaffold7581_cov258-Pinguiococcus_pyrenoidosus.AAC.1